MATRDDLIPVNNAKGGPFPSIELDVDAVHALGKEWADIVRQFTKSWCQTNEVSGPATVWDWSTYSLNFRNESRLAIFLVPQGFPKKFIKALGSALLKEAPGAIRVASDYCTPSRREGWGPTVHWQDGKAWLKECIDERIAKTVDLWAQDRSAPIPGPVLFSRRCSSSMANNP